MPPNFRRAIARQNICRIQSRNTSRSSYPVGRGGTSFKRVDFGDNVKWPRPGSEEPEVDSDDNPWSKLPETATLRRAFSGIQPTGIPHLGNYLGALRQWKQLHKQALDPKFTSRYHFEQLFSVVDLHALTSRTRPEDRSRLRKESYAALLAIGLFNNHNTTLFFQSDVSQHTSLMWILSTIASTGYLSRMTQWKSKLNLPDDANLDSEEAKAKLELGLFSYPVLQAADILLYQPSIVPVGEDQLQHVEFTRNLARRFNHHVKRKVFRIPWPVISPAKRIMSLKHPENKMSKSDPDPKSRILITDSQDEIHAKFRAAMTDSEVGISYDPERRPGVSNLVDILKHVTQSRESSEYIAKDNENVSMRAFKEMVADATIMELSGIREKFNEFMAENNYNVREQVEIGGKKARARARMTFGDVHDALGLSDFMLTAEEREAMRRRRATMRLAREAVDWDVEGNPWDDEVGSPGWGPAESDQDVDEEEDFGREDEEGSVTDDAREPVKQSTN